MNMVQAEELVYEYEKRDDEGNVIGMNRAIDEVDIDVEPGQFVAILGHNGSGKSTLAKHINAILVPTGGVMWVNGRDTRKPEELMSVRQSAGMVFQNPDNQIIGTVVEEDVGFGPENLGVPTDEIWTRVEESLRAVGMIEYRTHSPNKLSGGQKQRVAIAGVLAMSPQILIFDESTSMLDPQGKAEINELIQEIHKESKITIISITHDIEEVSKSDYVIVMDGGHVVMKGLPDDILRKEKELIDLQLDIPFALKFTKAMRAHGVDMKDCTTMEKVVDEVCRLHFEK